VSRSDPHEVFPDFQEKVARVMKVARRTRSEAPDWATFYRTMLGPTGVVRRVFRTPEELDAFADTDAYRELLKMLTDLRRRLVTSRDPEEEPTIMITVRVPASLHHALRAEAFDRGTTLNKLCISKLLQWIDQEMIAEDVPSLMRSRSGAENAEDAQSGSRRSHADNAPKRTGRKRSA